MPADRGASAQRTGGSKGAPPNASTACLECHSNPKLTMKKPGRIVSLFADQAILAKSAHGSLECADCHVGFDAESIPHQTTLKPVDCASCHEDAGRKMFSIRASRVRRSRSR